MNNETTREISKHEQYSRQKGRWVFNRLFIITGLLFLLVAIGLFIGVNVFTIELIDQWISQSKVWLGLWRLIVFIIIIGFWPHWSSLYAHWSSMNDEQLEQMLGYRWRIAVWMLVMEAVFSHNILSLFIHQIMQLGGAS